MAAIYNCAGLFVDIEGVNANVTLRHTLEEVPRTEELSSGRLTLATLITILKATLADFSDIVQTIKNSAMMPEDLPTRRSAEGDTPLKSVATDPVCTIWGKVNGITVTVTSADKPFHALTCYYAMRELSGMATPQQQPPARQSVPRQPSAAESLASVPNISGGEYTTAVERSASGTFELGEYDYNQKAQYGAQYNGQRVAFWVERIARGYKKDTTIPEFRMFSHDGFQYPDFYVDAEHAGNMLPLLEDITASGDAVGRWRVVVVVKQKGTKTYFNPVKIDAVRSMDTDGRDIGSENPF